MQSESDVVASLQMKLDGNEEVEGRQALQVALEASEAGPFVLAAREAQIAYLPIA